MHTVLHVGRACAWHTAVLVLVLAGNSDGAAGQGLAGRGRVDYIERAYQLLMIQKGGTAAGEVARSSRD